jgi:site-specific DNA-methyltransferase (adenine-specific)
MKDKMNKIHNIDCLEFMKTVPDNYFDLTLTDIPYNECDIENNGIWDKNTNMKDMGQADDFSNINMQELLTQFDRTCKGSFYIFCGIEQISEIRKFFRQKKYTTRLIIWEKTNPMPINGQYVFLSGIEACVWAKKPSATFNENCRNTVFKYPLGIDRTEHPTTKPLRLFEEFIKISTNEGDKVCDWFMGSGTTAKAAKALRREFCGTEIKKEYCDLSDDRLKEVQGSLF